jgi:hypothetical protein
MTGEPQGIFNKMHLIMSEIGVIGKEGRNDFQKYSFRGIAQVVDALTPLLVKHGVIMIPQYGSLQLHGQDKGFTATCNLQLGFICIEDGSNMFYQSVGQGADSGDKAANKAMTAAFKYALCHGLGIRENEVGTDADSDSPIVEKVGASAAKPKAAKPTVKNMLED